MARVCHHEQIVSRLLAIGYLDLLRNLLQCRCDISLGSASTPDKRTTAKHFNLTFSVGMRRQSQVDRYVREVWQHSAGLAYHTPLVIVDEQSRQINCVVNWVSQIHVRAVSGL